MDPLTALGLAAGVVQFVSFASHLITKTKEIHVSASGQTDEVATLETTYTRLHELSQCLETCSRRDPNLEIVGGHTEYYMKIVLAIRDLSRSCEGDCQKLLKIVEKLKTSGDSHRRWQTFRLALRTVWKGNEIAELEHRLHHTQMTLTMLVCSQTSFWHAQFNQALINLRSESLKLKAQQSDKLADISRALDELAGRITKVSTGSTIGANVFGPDDIEGIESQMALLSLCKAAAIKENRILRSLSFDSRPVRHSSITEASARTFEWAFKEAEPHRDTESSVIVTGRFLSWLREGDGVFWITGKPGSGKSTFMKLIADHPTTLRTLSQWARPKRPVLASHYFWSAGTPMQKSQQGLLQTLLHEIFRQLPDITESVCVERWSKTVEELDYEPWQVPELQSVLQRIADRQDIPVKFCFFLDGLDEFAGEHIDFCHSLRELSQSPNIKLCVSSREWNVFEDSFGSAGTDRKLYIHDLTYDDIRFYAGLRLQNHPRWKGFCDEAPNASWLLDEITKRAAGVFLWAFLVTRELRSGLSEYDSFSDMRRRLECIPVDLEDFFKRMLESVERFYIPKMATTLQMALAATAPVDVAVYGLHELEDEDHDYAFKIPLRTLGDSGPTPARELTRRRLKARCRGLVEVNCHSNRVEFLHRTVMDFLRTAEMSTFLADKAPPGFDARLSLTRALTAYVKATEFLDLVDRRESRDSTESPLISAVQEVLHQVRELRGGAANTAYLLLDELDRCIPEMNRIGQAHLMIDGNHANPVSQFFREAVLNASLVEYLVRTLPGRPDYFADFEEPALKYSIVNLVDSFRDNDEIHPYREFVPANSWTEVGMIRCLLENGCDPNKSYYSIEERRQTTPWKDFLHLHYSNLGADGNGEAWSTKRAILEEVINLMLQYGAHSFLLSKNPRILQPLPSAMVRKRTLSQVDPEPPVTNSKRYRGL